MPTFDEVWFASPAAGSPRYRSRGLSSWRDSPRGCDLCGQAPTTDRSFDVWPADGTEPPVLITTYLCVGRHADESSLTRADWKRILRLPAPH